MHAKRDLGFSIAMFDAGGQLTLPNIHNITYNISYNVVTAIEKHTINGFTA
jgi:hypothetical protein